MNAGHEWDAASYHLVSGPQVAWGEAFIRTLDLSGDEHTLDVGCGSGRLTKRLAELLPHGRLTGVDRSAPMLAQARRTLAGMVTGAGPVTLVQADAAALPFVQAADLLFSTATFHWVPDHGALFDSLWAALRPKGRLWAQCGGGANLARFHAGAERIMRTARFAPYFQSWRPPWNFQTAEATRAQLIEAGFADVETALFEAPIQFPDADAYWAFVRTVVAGPHLAHLPDERLREAFMDELTAQGAAADPPFELDYWRLNLKGRRR
jgi:trans-aconitate 2-methyltransferase